MTVTIALARLRELWFHTGTACNLECPFCLEGSRPGDTRLERLKLEEIKPYLDEAAALGVERFCFTGGEPLIVKDIVKILSYALELRPCLVLTNGTAPLIKRAHQLAALKERPHALSFRVSLDRPAEHAHDAARGWGNFKRALEGLKLLHRAGFDVSIARHSDVGERTREIEAQYRELLSKHGLPQDLPLCALPELGRPGADPSESAPMPTENLHSAMCTTTRIVVKRDHALRVYACPLTDDDSRFELGSSLAASLSASVAPTHRRCAQCAACGVQLG